VTREGLRLIEEALGIRLPESYRARMAALPVPAAAGNSDLGVWDDVDRLIAFNLELRRGAPGGVKPWPPHFFAIGHAGDGCPYALDLSQGDAVWWVDHCHLDNAGSCREAESFSQWADEYFGTLREEMAGEGVDPDASPARRAAAEAKSARAGAYGCAMVAALVGAAVAVVLWLARR
jgi:hypothetical protein